MGAQIQILIFHLSWQFLTIIESTPAVHVKFYLRSAGTGKIDLARESTSTGLESSEDRALSNGSLDPRAWPLPSAGRFAERFQLRCFTGIGAVLG